VVVDDYNDFIECSEQAAGFREVRERVVKETVVVEVEKVVEKVVQIPVGGTLYRKTDDRTASDRFFRPDRGIFG
jgi:hypothetical protein